VFIDKNCDIGNKSKKTVNIFADKVDYHNIILNIAYQLKKTQQTKKTTLL
jgi:hypothetical protein